MSGTSSVNLAPCTYDSNNSDTNFGLAPFMALTIAAEQRLGVSVLMTTKRL